VWLGLSIGCAQCHDHKFDPVSQVDYYRLFAFFNNQADAKLKVTDPRVDTAQLIADRDAARAEVYAYVEARADALAAASLERLAGPPRAGEGHRAAG
jgi:hypothetical protein